MSKPKLVLIRWVDAISVVDWAYNVTEGIVEGEHCQSVGWLVTEDEGHVVIAAASNNAGRWADRTRFPRSMIESVTVLRDPAETADATPDVSDGDIYSEYDHPAVPVHLQRKATPDMGSEPPRWPTDETNPPRIEIKGQHVGPRPCDWCGERKSVGYCAIVKRTYCLTHRPHHHTHVEIEAWHMTEAMKAGEVKPEEGEHCQRCGRTYLAIGWWSADPDLWAAVTGRTDGTGLFCPDCFGTLAHEQGIGLGWHPEIDWIDEYDTGEPE